MRDKLKQVLLICLPAAFLLGFALAGMVMPDKSLSVSERRPLASLPTVSVEGVLNGRFMTQLEEYTLDQFPLRDSFRGFKALISFSVLRQRDNHGVYAVDGYLSKLDYPLYPESLDYAAERFRFVYERYLKDKDIQVYLSVIPDKNYFLAASNGYPSMDYPALFARMQQQTEFADYIDLVPLLEASDYYRTDTHWRQEKIGDVAAFLAQQMGVSMDSTYETGSVDLPFYGVYSGQLALPLPGEELHYLTNQVIEGYQVYDYETQSTMPVYDLDKAAGQDPYEMFLGGPKSLITVENPNASTDRELILFRDSFGSSIAPLLAQGYAKITLVDIRYIAPELLGHFVDFQNQDVLFLYSSSVLNHSITIK